MSASGQFVFRPLTSRDELIRMLKRGSSPIVRRRAEAVGRHAVENCSTYASRNFYSRVPDRRRFPGQPQAVNSFSSVIEDQWDSYGEISVNVRTRSTGAWLQHVGTDAHQMDPPKSLPKESWDVNPYLHTRVPMSELKRRKLARMPKHSFTHPGSRRHEGFMLDAVEDAIEQVIRRAGR